MSNTNLAAEIFAFAGGGAISGGAVAALITGMFGRGVNTARTAQIVTEMWEKSAEADSKKITRLEGQIERLEAKLERFDARNDEQQAEVTRLREEHAVETGRQRDRIAELVALVRDELIPPLESHGVDVGYARSVLGRPA